MPQHASAAPTFNEALAVWARIGVLSFGGPAGQIALMHRVLVEAWPRLTRRVAFVEGALEAVEILDTDVVVSSHACGALTDVVLARAAAAHARVAVLPCCHDLAIGNDGGVSGWIDGPLAIDIRRAYQLSERGYRIWTQTISGDITPKNRLLIGAPRATEHNAQRGTAVCPPPPPPPLE